MCANMAIPYLLYDDVQTALDWVVDLLRCTVVDTQLDKQGNLLHADFRLVDARIES